jgi:large subunit ribosomal protein L10
MRAEKQYISSEYIDRLNGSPFFIVVDFTGLTVEHFSEFRKRLSRVEAEIHVVKNSIFRIAVKEAGLGDLTGSLSGQTAVLTGQRDISAAAKVVKTFKAEFEKPEFKFGFLGNQRLEIAELTTLADLPSLDVLRGKLVGVIQAPSAQLVRLLGTPATQLTRVLKAKAEKE